jgi:hypothetical protein
MNDSEHGMQIHGHPGVAPVAESGHPGAMGAAPAAAGPADPPPTAANPAALTVAQAARLLGVAEQTVRDHVAAGVPTAANGTINLVHYAAWLNRELKNNDAD